MAEEGKYSSKSLSYVEMDTRVLLDIVIDFDAAIPQCSANAYVFSPCQKTQMTARRRHVADYFVRGRGPKR